MKFNDFLEEMRHGIEIRVQEVFAEGIVSIRTVTKNNNVKMKAITITRGNINATPTIYMDGYYKENKRGRAIDDICDEILDIYKKSLNNVVSSISIDDFSDFNNVKSKILYKLVNYDMNKKMLEDVPHFRYLDLAIVFYVLVSCEDYDMSTLLIYNELMDTWNITEEELRDCAFKNTWEMQPFVIKKMEDIISEMIMDDLMKDEEGMDNLMEDEEGMDNLMEDDTNFVEEDTQYNGDSYEEIKEVVREEVKKMKADRDLDMYVLTNSFRVNGATCITYPGVVKDFAKEMGEDIFIIPSSIHEVILVPGVKWEKEKMDEMVIDVNKRELDPVEVLSDHVYVYKKNTGEITY